MSIIQSFLIKNWILNTTARFVEATVMLVYKFEKTMLNDSEHRFSSIRCHVIGVYHKKSFCQRRSKKASVCYTVPSSRHLSFLGQHAYGS